MTKTLCVYNNVYNGMGNDLFVDAAESASFPLPGTGKREGGGKTQPLQRFTSHLGITTVAQGYSSGQIRTFVDLKL